MSKKNVAINYTSRDFESIRRDLEEFAKRYYPNTYKDFNRASFGSLMLDSVSYIGDILSFYLDYQMNETFLDSAIEYNNVVRLARQLGYKLQTSPSSYGRLGNDAFKKGDYPGAVAFYTEVCERIALALLSICLCTSV